MPARCLPAYCFPVLLGLASVFAPVAVNAQSREALAEHVRSAYTKYETEIPMRDGVKLFTAIYLPKDTSRSYGILLKRTPYSVRPYGVNANTFRVGPSEKLVREGFIFVHQDVRGRFMSEDVFEWISPHNPNKSEGDVDESTDTYDTIDWLVKNVPNNNGRVGTYGISYPGFFAAAGMIDAHPAHIVSSPQAPVNDTYRGDDTYHNGVFYLAANFGFLSFFKHQETPTLPEQSIRFDYDGMQDGYEFYLAMGPLSNANEKYLKGEHPYWNHMVEHTTYDEFWQARSLDTFLENVPPAVMSVGGWFDAEDPMGPLKVFRAVEERDPETSNHLVMGPWAHGGWARGDGDSLGHVSFGAKTSEFYREEIEFPFYDFHLNGNGEADLPKAWVFETGTDQWRRFEGWPPANAEPKKLYFHDGGRLSFKPPSDESLSEGGDAYDEYVNDPNRPVPFTEEISLRVPRTYMVADQRFAAKRPDVLVYQTDVLESDVTICGPVSPDLWVSTSGTDADFVVKLIDVYPNDHPDPDPNPDDVTLGGYQQLVRGEPFRAKFRNSLTTPEPMVPNELARITYTMPDVCHAFRRGHRIMIQVQSSWFPLNDRNPQVFTDIPNAQPEDFKKATQRVSRSQGKASSVELMVMPAVIP